VEISGEPGVSYVTTFIGTLRDFDPTRGPGRTPPKGNPVVTGEYSNQIGAVLGRMAGLTANYEFAGDELYVRAKVTSSKIKTNSYRRDDFESAWVQPAVVQSNILWAALQPAKASK